ncbi:unnamed protein product [Cercopithifilaria johnstoni]|uniref:BPTI/Kunitz inhibitor domain-containing protein n=1 Tax=Cercopithifilaria johnstoni TaxID=2874296 RepID=A0A8J2Q4Q3_9BILA|nr:unnamed protein product [Cercopithifilaria johnstoni]
MSLSNIRYYITFIKFLYAFTVIQANKNIENITLIFNDTGIGIEHYCEEGLPLLLANDTVKKCLPDENSDSSMLCPKNFWCHIGATQNSWYCCPKNRKVKERCYLTSANGYGSGEIQRFWYDWKSSTCKQLIYGGYGGNENNFLTKIDCEKACLGKQLSKSLLTYNSFSNKHDSGNQKFSVNEQQNAIENVDLNPCELSPDRGTSVTGISSSYRWYFDIAADRCIRFNYLGSAGNANNFETDRQCLETCGTGNTSDVNICLLPNISGTGPYKIPRFYYDTRNNACKQFVYAGFGGNNNRFIKHEQCSKACLNFGSFVTTTTIVPPPFVTTQIAVTEMYTLSTDLTFDFEKFKQLQVFTTVLPEHSAFVEGLKELTTTTTTTTTATEYAMPFDENFNVQNAASHLIMTRNDEINLNQPNQKVNGIIDVISKAITEPCLQSLPTGFQLQYCSPMDSFLCPRGTFCQIGVGPQETFCCPIIADNPCKQTQESGIGLTGLGRWYYDANDNHCKTFIFNGFKGNQNNFLTFRACQQSCGAVNPCESGEPQIQTNAPEQCSPENIYSCPQGYYCRISDDLTKTACCPGIDHTILSHGKTMILNPIGNINSASGNTYNLKGGSSFTNTDYTKRGIIDSLGNANMDIGSISPVVESVNYVNNKPITLNEYLNSMATTGINSNFGNISQPNMFIGQVGTGIETPHFNRAEAFVNSSPAMPKNALIPDSPKSLIGSGIPIFSGNSMINTGVLIDPLTGITYGNARISNGFNRGTQNLISNAPIKTIQGNRCLLPPASGTGTYSLPRYYFDREASTCRPFIYSGFGGNDNYFETIRECRMACPEYDNPCPVGLPYIDEDGNVAFCSSANPLCPTNYWCHIGDRRQTSVCCPSLANMNALPIANPLRQLRSIVRNLNGLSLNMGIDPAEHNDAPGTIPLACFQPLLEGRGRANLTRYYFNSRKRICEKFIYTGKGGNQNNFLSKTDCEETCPILENPCENGLPAIGPEGNPMLCGSDTATICGIGYYCHVGATSSTTVCCPAIGDPCRMPVSRGNGNAVLNRWYYNMQSQICVNFVYSGQGGNSNNFRTREDCTEACPEFRNPCSAGRPHIGLNGQITHCGATGPLICPTTYWCHIGASLENSVCCPTTGMPCEQDLYTGNGDAILVRFYYDSTTRTCQQFQYSGLGGNENNFLTLRDCEAHCPVLPNPCGLGQPQMDEHRNLVMCSAANTRPVTWPLLLPLLYYNK